ncbi:hypothetical protein HMPREF9123_0624 [Neisseria bacilliformis ATCC BAA-1200]|uniref:Uncharacterized protein n=1 Tax=Neisseria bacilliformis ATCC BAA-1200 TaxID=888742 RepID=F2BA70_9NEIS|nr:hypothetical protein HMPREF9123_0624 [Neisseria bacilliformis ATCC BAA-1200]
MERGRLKNTGRCFSDGLVPQVGCVAQATHAVSGCAAEGRNL